MGKRLHGLDTLRGVAALLVFWMHFRSFYSDVVRPDHAFLAVDFFFVLSGYVMARSYESGSWDGFVLKRARRLLPMIYLGAAIGVIAYGSSAKDILFMLLLVPSAGNFVFPLNNPAWSIAYELFGNALHRVLRPSNKALLVIILTSGLLLTGAIYSNGSASLGNQPSTYLAGIPRLLFSYFLGVGLYRWLRDDPPFHISPVMCLAILPIVSFVQGNWLTDMAFIVVGSPLLIIGGLRLPRIPIIGAISFPLYATHYPVLKLFEAQHWSVPLVIAIGLAIILAYWRVLPVRSFSVRLKANRRPC